MPLSLGFPLRIGLGLACCAPGWIVWGAAGTPVVAGWYAAMFVLAALLYGLGAAIFGGSR